MADKQTTGELFGVPYNFDRPSMRRMLTSYWQPGKGMLVKKPFGIGYTLNLANWRSWLVVAVTAALVWHDRQSAAAADRPEEAVEVVVDD